MGQTLCIGIHKINDLTRHRTLQFELLSSICDLALFLLYQVHTVTLNFFQDMTAPIEACN